MRPGGEVVPGQGRPAGQVGGAVPCKTARQGVGRRLARASGRSGPWSKGPAAGADPVLPHVLFSAVTFQA